MKVYQNICETIGHTPIVKLSKINKIHNVNNNIFAKIEKMNPGGSIKDRIAYEIIKTEFENGKINKDTIIIEATSGNTGIGLAMVCAFYGLKLIIVMPKGVSDERIQILKLYGAKIILSRKKEGVEGSIKKAKKILTSIDNGYFVNQFENKANVESHYRTTAEEIVNDFDEKIDYVFVGMGSTGTIMGIAKKIKEYDNKIKIIGVEPLNCPFFTKKKKGKYFIPGIGSTFLPKITNFNLIDDMVLIKDDEAQMYKEELSLNEGILVGYSSGAVLAAAICYLKEKRVENKNVILIFPDGGERYLSIKNNKKN